jgi:hypothetical protein
MVQPAPRIIKAPEKKRAVVPRTVRGGAMDMGAARSVLKRQGKKR